MYRKHANVVQRVPKYLQQVPPNINNLGHFKTMSQPFLVFHDVESFKEYLVECLSIGVCLIILS